MTNGERILVDLRKAELTGTPRNWSPAVVAARLGITTQELTEAVEQLEDTGDVRNVAWWPIDQLPYALAFLGTAALTPKSRRRADSLIVSA